jgi:AcrR family transcriptional regulator
VPKAFSDKEREYIKKRLMEEAQNCLRLYGIRKTTVDELVKRANIPKGTFYLFFRSKEILFYEVLCSFHDQLQDDLMREIRSVGGHISAEQLTEMLLSLYKKLDGSFWYRLITDGDLELLLHRLPPEVAHEHAGKDDLSIEQLISMIPGLNCSNIKVFSAAMRAIFLSMLHRHEIGEEVFDDALRLMIRGVVVQMLGEGLK